MAALLGVTESKCEQGGGFNGKVTSVRPSESYSGLYFFVQLGGARVFSVKQFEQKSQCFVRLARWSSFFFARRVATISRFPDFVLLASIDYLRGNLLCAVVLYQISVMCQWCARRSRRGRQKS